MKTLLTYLFLLCTAGLYAGVGKDTLALDEVIKVESISSNVQAYESPFTDLKYEQGKRLSDALGEFSSVYVKNYGSGGLASLAIRGTSAEQTEIQWNGVKLNSPSLGQVDLALFALGMQDELQLVRTGYHGTIGGVLNMSNETAPDSGYSAGGTFRVGSFGMFEAMSNAQYGNQKFSGSTRFSYLTSQNDFLYRNLYEEGNPYTRQTNATVHQLSFLQQLNAKLNDNHELSLDFWLTDATRQIPPIMSQPVGHESQDDYSIRALLGWNGKFKKLKTKFTSAYLNDKIHYKDPAAAIDETSVTQAIRNNMNFSYAFPINLVLNSDVNYDYEQANISEYGTPKTRNTIGFKTYADYYLLNHLRLHAGFREDLVDTRLSAFAPELSANYSTKAGTKNYFSGGIFASRNFRFPTLNDLYWSPGGNPNLKEEKSLNGELRVKYAYKKAIEVSLSNFYLYVNDWIQWVPQGINWAPVNFKRVFSRGLEASLHLTNADESHPQRFTVHFNASYSFTKTTNLDSSSAFDQSKGKQLIYVPLHNVVTGVQLQYRKFYLRSVNNYTGIVYTSADNSQFLNGYFTSDIEVGKDFSFKNLDIGFSFRVNNVGNTQYQNVAAHPMPGRNYEGTLRFKFFSK